MEINVLAINVGNTRIALGCFSAGNLIHAARVDVADRNAWPAAFDAAWEKLDRDDAAVVGACVNPPQLEAVEHVAFQATEHAIQWIGRQIDLPVPPNSDIPDGAGVDRLLNIAAAFEQMEKACVVVDAGTALTVNCCDDRGAFTGGAILPGAQLMLDALHDRIPALPSVKLAAATGTIGRNTVDAMRHGVFHGLRGAVRELIEQYATEIGTWPELIVTGGDATLIFGEWELVHAVAPDLTLYGIALAYAEHHIMNGT